VEDTSFQFLLKYVDGHEYFKEIPATGNKFRSYTTSSIGKDISIVEVLVYQIVRDFMILEKDYHDRSGALLYV
jgi:hypothetical protein